MLFKNITILDEDLEIKEACYVGIKDRRIDYIRKEMPESSYGRVYPGKGRLLMSGFVNSHAHTPMSLMRGYGENMGLQSWLNERIFPFEGKLNDKDVYYSTLLGIAESLQFGIVSSTDMYYFCDSMAEAILKSGVKNNLSRGLTCFSDDDLWDLAAFKESKELFQQYHNSGNGRIKVDMSLHAEYTSNPKIAAQLSEYTKELGTGMHVHVSETEEEHEACKERNNGRTPIGYFNELGLFDSRTTAAHCVYAEKEDLDILMDKGVTVATCPVSNLKLASGVCPVPDMLKMGINVALGTDSVSSNNSLNYIEEIKFFSLVNKEKYGDPTLVTPKEALFAATRAGASGQGRGDTGRLKEGHLADLIVLDIDRPHMHPVHDLINNIVYSASGRDVVMTMVDGKILYEDGLFFTIDIERVKYEVESSRTRILAGLK